MLSYTLLVGTGVVSADIIMPTVLVGNAGNLADPSTGYGAVGYAYRIGTDEVTAGQYAAFLNKVAATDTYSLYNPIMADITGGCGISQGGVSGGYTYTVDPACIKRPVNFVSFWDACRFANWLNNGQLGAGTTETGAYTLTNTAGITNNTIARNPGATWAVTSEDEWYKAAYYDPNKNGVNSPGYWLYPTKSDTAPGEDMADVSSNNANYYGGLGLLPIQYPYYTTVVGQFANSASPCGTFDQGGNVWEWNEAIIDQTSRGLRGGGFYYPGYFLQSGARSDFIALTSAGSDYGFRVVNLAVPEPASLGILSFGAIGMPVRRRGARK